MIVKLYHTYTLFYHNVRIAHRQIATFSANREFFWINAPYKYYYLLTDEFLVDKYVWCFYAITRTN